MDRGSAVVVAIAGSLAGLIGGMVATTLVHHRTSTVAPQPSEKSVIALAPTATQASETGGCRPPETQQLAPFPKTISSSGDTHDEERHDEDLAPEDRRVRAVLRQVDEHNELLRKHQEEPRDVTWARAMEAKVETYFTGLQMPKDATVEVDCRTRTCSAKMRFSDWTTLEKKLPDVVQGGAQGFECTRRVTVPPITDPKATPAEAEMWIDCTPNPYGSAGPGRGASR